MAFGMGGLLLDPCTGSESGKQSFLGPSGAAQEQSVHVIDKVFKVEIAKTKYNVKCFGEQRLSRGSKTPQPNLVKELQKALKECTTTTDELITPALAKAARAMKKNVADLSLNFTMTLDQQCWKVSMGYAKNILGGDGKPSSIIMIENRTNCQD